MPSSCRLRFDTRSAWGMMPGMVVGLSRLRDARQRLDARRSTHPQLDTALQLIELQDESGGGLLAAAIAFRFFLFVIPFVFVVVMGLGLGAEAAGADIKEVARRAGITGVAAAAVEWGASASSTARWTTLLI